MAQVLVWIALVLSVLVLGYAFARSRGGKRRAATSPIPSFLPTVAVLAAGFCLTLPVQAPWSPGQTLGPGFLLGGAAVLLAVWTARRLVAPAPSGTQNASFLAHSAVFAAVTLGASVLLLLYHARALDALGGYALGALAAGLLAGGAHSAAAGEDEGETASAVETAALTAVALAAATYLATFHRSAAGIREWQPLPTLLLATLAAALTGRAALPTGGGVRWPTTLATVLLPLVVISWLMGHRLGGSPAFFTVVLVGLAVFGLVAWLGSA
ncbi:MAG TPA: hypothetical protein VK689_16760, partial [Armatimonadota bacterium]|nr:hypothetical protein [Armatimonadota bacterium]